MSTITAAQGSSAAASTPPSERGFSALSSEGFLKLIFAEMSRQDPLAPNDTSKLLEQLSSVRSIQSDLDLSNKLQGVVDQNQFSSASMLIGRMISGVSQQNERVSGQVLSVSRTKEGPVLNVEGGKRIAMNNVDEVRLPQNGSAR